MALDAPFGDFIMIATGPGDRNCDFLGPLLAAMLPAVISGVAGMAGQASANDANEEEAQRNRDFQREMSNTQWQRARADLDAAGFNPMLAVSQGGNAAMPGSMSAPHQNVGASVAPSLGMVASTAVQVEQAKKLAAETANQKIRNAVDLNMLGPLVSAQLRVAQEDGWGRTLDNQTRNAFNEANLDRIRSEILRNSTASAVDVAREGLAGTERSLLQTQVPGARLRQRGFELLTGGVNSAIDVMKKLGRGFGLGWTNPNERD